jgi:hypothetical protein
MVKRNGTTSVDTSTGNAEFDAKIEKLMAFMSQPKEKAQSAAQLIARAIAERKGEAMGPASSACRASIGSVHTGSAGGNAIEPDHVVDSGRPPRAPRAVEGGADAVGIEQHPTRCAICTGRTFVRAKRNTLETPSRVSPGFMMASYWGSPADRDAASAGSDRHNPQ